MGKGQTDRKQQREFLFILNSKPTRGQAVAKNEKMERATCARRTNLNSDEAKAARKKLIAELREFGC